MKTITKIVIIGLLAFVFVFVLQAISPSGADAYIIRCRQDSDCGQNKFTGEQYCQSNNLHQDYVTNTCNNPGTQFASCTTLREQKLVQTCSQGCEAGLWYIGCIKTNSTQNSTNTNPNTPYVYNYYTRCVGNSVYWFDSQNRQQNLYQTCPSNQTCSGNTCTTSYIAPPYTSHTLKGCVNNTSYWYDSLGNQQDAYQNCNLTGQTCSNGQCIGAIITTPTPTPAPKSTNTQNPYVLHYVTRCYNNDIYWYDSKDAVKDLFVSCTDNNQCTKDACGDGRCQNELMCDGSTCATNSEDYLKYCASVAAVSEGPLAGFLKKWYIWIILAIVLVFLFIIVFRRLSSNNG